MSGLAGEREAAAVGEAGGERVMRRLSSLKAMTVEMSLATRKAKRRPMAAAWPSSCQSPAMVGAGEVVT